MIVLYYICSPSKALDINLKCHLKKKKCTCFVFCARLIIPILQLWYLLC